MIIHIPVPVFRFRTGNGIFPLTRPNNANASWVSNTVSKSFQVDTDDPVVKITSPNDKDTVSGTVEIKGTFTDSVPENYQLKIKDHSGATVYDSGAVVSTSGLINNKIYDWDTTKVVDGNYTIELKGTDGPGNTASDSIKVTVGNNSSVVLNEILPDPAGSDNSDKDHSEFVELYNNDKISHDLNGWRIYIGDSDFIEINNTTTDGAGTVIDSKSRLVVWFYKKWSSSELKNSSDTVSLYDGPKASAKKYDSYTYSYSGSKIGSSFVRDPDGVGDWKDPIPDSRKEKYNGRGFFEISRSLQKNLF